MDAARRHRFALTVHAIDGTGALCGVRPHGRWVPSTTLPISCPRCLYRLSRPRYAFCETPVASSRSSLHVRRVGPEGISMSGNGAHSTTLCGAIVGWDINEVDITDRAELTDRRVCPTCARLATAPHLASQR